MTKKDQILRLWAEGKNRREIAAIVGCPPVYANIVKWRAERPGYGAKWMREYRKDHPEVRARESEVNRKYANHKYATDPVFREKVKERNRRRYYQQEASP